MHPSSGDQGQSTIGLCDLRSAFFPSLSPRFSHLSNGNEDTYLLGLLLRVGRSVAGSAKSLLVPLRVSGESRREGTAVPLILIPVSDHPVAAEGLDFPLIQRS